MERSQAEGVSEKVIKEVESPHSTQRELEQFSEQVLLFILEVLRARDRAK